MQKRWMLGCLLAVWTMDPEAQSWDVNVYGPDTLLRLQDAGAVFLPADGFRVGLEIKDIDIASTDRGFNCYYWTAMESGDDKAQMIYINASGPQFVARPRSQGMSVRLVKDAESEQGIEDIVVPDTKTRKVLMDGVLYILRDGKIYTTQGIQVK